MNIQKSSSKAVGFSGVVGGRGRWGGVVVLGLGCGHAFSATVPYTLALTSARNPDEQLTTRVVNSAPAIPSMASYERSGSWGNMSGFASADLTTGQLKARATNRPAIGVSPYMQSNAWFGDGFRASTPSGPFTWGANSRSRFTMEVDGSFLGSGPMETLGFGGVGGFVLLSLYQPGTLDPTTRLVGGPSNIGYYLYLLGNSTQDLRYTDQAGVSQSLIPTATYPDFSNGIRIEQGIQPNGDFDWMLLLGVSGQVTGPQFYELDFSRTLNLSYSGPEGTTTSSESGLFQNYVPIPEPGSVVALGVVAVAAGSRRRRI